jgi:diguanylate cyclase (GGDEF)-like protein
MPANSLLWQSPRTLVIAAAAVPLALAVLAEAMRVRRQLDAARHDPLTGLLGRDGYTARATALTARRTRAAMVLIRDVDQFKQINDTHSHVAGDGLLAVTAQRLTAWAGSHRIGGRLGGDEFTLTVRIEPADRRLRLRLEQMAAALAEHVDIGDGLVDVAVSVGAATPTGSAPPTVAAAAGRRRRDVRGQANGPAPGGRAPPRDCRMTPTAYATDVIGGISIEQPWAACILHGDKRVENRPRPWTPGRRLLHAGATIDRAALRDPLVARTIRGRELPTHAVLGVLRITGSHTDDGDRMGSWKRI